MRVTQGGRLTPQNIIVTRHVSEECILKCEFGIKTLADFVYYLVHCFMRFADNMVRLFSVCLPLSLKKDDVNLLHQVTLNLCGLY